MTSAAIVLLLTSVMLMAMQLQPAAAQISAFQQSIDVPAGETPTMTCDTWSILSFRPNPVGVGQSLLINAWINPSLNTNRGILSAQTGAYKLTLTKPDGNTEVITMPSTFSECTSYVEYVPDQVGEWTIKFDFLGTYWPAGQYYNGWKVDNSSGTYIDSNYLRPSSTGPFTFTVQADMVLSWPPSPLPTDYWTRPVNFNNREWWPILGNWPPIGYNGDYFGVLWDQMYPDTNPAWNNNYNFAPFVQGPESAHVVWKIERGGSRQGGIQGAYATQEGQYINPDVPTVVYGGRCYQTYTKPGVGSVAACYDLRTGEIYYEIPMADGGVTPQYVTYVNPSANTRYGEELAGASHTIELVAIQNNFLYKVHPFTGAITLNVSVPSGLSPSGGSFNTQNSFHNQINGYVAVVQNLGSSVPEDQRYRLINWTTSGSTNNFDNRIISNTSYARSSIPSYVDWNEGIAVNTIVPTPPGIAGWYGLELDVYDLYTGVLIRNITSPHPDTSYSPLSTCVDHGLVAMPTQGGHVKAWNARTGQLAWDFTMDYPWSATGWGVYGVATGYGLFFRPAYDGLYAINWTTGELAWKTSRYTRAAFESPYTDVIGGAEVNPGMTNVRIADEKVYIYDGEHSVDQPKDRAWSLYCYDVYTGELLWDIAMTGNTAFGQEPSTGPIVDGYLMFPATNGIMYTFGRGKTVMTMTGPTVEIPLGTKAVVSGTVLDMSPAQPNTPCVSKDSMRTQMEYLHLQYPIAGIWGNETINGVPVRLTAIAEDGSVTDLGTTVSNGYTGVFTFAWAPPAEGKYEIVASFGPDESYGSSTASSAIYVGSAAEQQQQPIDIQQTDYMPTLYVILVAVIVAIIIGIAAALLALRKN